MKIKYHIDNVDYRIKDNKSFCVIHGWFFSLDEKKYDVNVYVNNKKEKVEINSIKREDVKEANNKYNLKENAGFEARVEINEKETESVIVKIENSEESKEVLKLSNKHIRKMIAIYNNNSHHIVYSLDNKIAHNNQITITGWAINLFSDKPVKILVYDKDNNEVPVNITKVERKDVLKKISKTNKNIMCGFNLTFKFEGKENYRLVFKSSKTYISKNLSVKRIIKGSIKQQRKQISFISVCKRLSVKRVIKGIKVLIKEGPLAFYEKLNLNIKVNNQIIYQDWYESHKVTKEQLEGQRNHKFEYNPLISIAIPLFKTDHKFLVELIDSIVNQSYQNFEVCFADGSPTDELKGFIDSKYPGETRIKYKKLEDNLGISENTNAAIEMATGDFIMFSDHDDLLCLDALYEMVYAINEDRDIEAIYTDEDKTNFENSKFFEPHFKPDYSIDLLTSVNYICHIFMVKKELADKVGYLNSEYNGAQDYDFVLRCCEKAKKIHHVPRILYHWRCHEQSTAANPASKMYAFEAGRRAIEAHYERVGIEATVENTKNLGLYRSKIKVQGNPMVSIIIPNKDHTDDLDICIQSVLKKSTYDNYEIIIVENNSELEETFEYYKKIEKNEKCRVIYWKSIFNYSAINNFGAKEAKGEYLILLNNDTEIIAENWMEEMLSYCQREDVGIVGARLYYPDDTIQHAGVILGFGGIAGHAAIGQSRYELGYMARPCTVQDMSAVTAACLMIDKNVFQEVEGLDESFKVAFNDVDLCMKVRDKGYLIVYNPYVELYHYESKSRGYEDTPEKVERFNSEIRRFQEKWTKELEAGDPFYNKNLSLNKADYSLREEEEI